MKKYNFDELRAEINKAVEKEYTLYSRLCDTEFVGKMSRAEKHLELIKPQ